MFCFTFCVESIEMSCSSFSFLIHSKFNGSNMCRSIHVQHSLHTFSIKNSVAITVNLYNCVCVRMHNSQNNWIIYCEIHPKQFKHNCLCTLSTQLPTDTCNDTSTECLKRFTTHQCYTIGNSTNSLLFE